ncbi:MAG: MarR family transcriptional regulator [Desulfobacula sp.]|uniref:MarR family winged helix-turn-helix transcriptional regulator n=1 Tax=Desulfobacula sp. TaxID=2593537 RepID=UPI0025BF2A87|nr:MarR family transcriptional regulator [Desulfobacula sp.]MCD4721276.1 MarR family transcriptional regulator [Desulfobacula sp.]
MLKVDKIQNFKETFLRLINKFKILEKIPIDHGTGHLLYASEINTLEIIGKLPGINITELSKRKGVTKGAVSQIVTKLEKKQLIIKFKDPENEKVVLLRLGKKGKIAFRNHEKFHEKYDSAIIEKLNEMSVEQIAFLTNTFGILEETMDHYLNDLK